MIPNSNLVEYENPDLYDLENSCFEPDGPFFLEVAHQVGGRVLENGCGTGRMTIPMAQAGVEMTGLDIVPQMLERAKAKAGELPIVERYGDWDRSPLTSGSKYMIFTCRQSARDPS